MTDHLPALSIAETDELVALARLLSEGAFEADQQTRLDELVHQRGDGQATYFRASQLGAAVQWYFAPEAAAVRQKMPSLLEEICNGSSLAGLEFVPQPSVRLTKRAITLTTLASQWKGSWLSPRVLGFAVIGLLVTYFSLIIFSVIWDQSHPNRHELINLVATDESTFATIASAVDCQWKESTPKHIGERLDGSTVSLQRGIVELSLDRGAKVTIEGPADWSVDGSNRVSLRSGKLIASVPPQAIGFTVETPTAEIVDLGTEFGVEVSESGATEVQVSKGRIELYSGAKSSRLSKAPSVVLSAGAARRVEAVDNRGNYSVREIASVPDRFANLISSATEGPIVVRDAIASSTDSVANHRARYLVNGRGLTGEAHANSSVGTMWHSATGEAKRIFVLFDLGLPYQLKAMKVWNHNDQQYDGFRSSGVKQADIYVSSSGTGSPFSHPKNWKLIVADQKFALATGKSDYSTPETISLPNAEARYVAITIDEAWRLPSRVAAPLFKFRDPQSVKFDESENKSAMYGSEFVASAPLAVTALGAWVSEKYRVANRTQSEYAATLYRVQGESLQLEKRVTIPVGTDIDSSGFAFIPVSLKLESNTSYAVAAHLGNTVVRKTPYCYGLDVGRFGYGTTFVRSRYAHTDEDTMLPLSSTERLKLGPLIGGNLLVQPTAEVVDPADQNVEVDGVGLSEVQFFGTRVGVTSTDK